MKKGSLLRGAVLLVAVMMLFSITACGGGAGGSAEKSTAEKSTADQGTAQATTQAEKELVTLTVFPVNFPKNYSSGIQEDLVAKDIENKLKIKMDMDTQPTSDKFTAMLASGSLPDVICWSDNGSYSKQMIEGKNIIELDSLVEKYGPDIQKNAQIAMNFSKKTYSNGTNKLYLIPGLIADVNEQMRVSPWGVIVGPFIRWDYYKELGAPEIKGDDDFLNTVAQILKKHPVNEEGQKFFGFSPWFDQGIQFMTNEYYRWLYGKYSWNSLQSDRTNVDVSVPIYTTPDSGFWQGVEFWYKANKMGLLDPDSLTQKNADALQKAGANRVIASTFQWPVQGTTTLLAGKGMTGKGFASYPIPVTGANNYYDIPSPNGNISRSWVISTNCKYPERAMELINYFFSVDGINTVLNGFKDQQWMEENGKYKYTDEFIKMKKEDKDWDAKTGVSKYLNIQGLASSFINPNTGEPLDLSLSRATIKAGMSDVDKDMATFYKVDTLLDLAPKDSTNNVDIAGAVAGLVNGTATDDIKRIDDKINNYLNVACVKAIMAKSDEDFAKQKQTIMDELKSKYEYDTSYSFWDGRWKEAVVQWKEISVAK